MENEWLPLLLMLMIVKGWPSLMEKNCANGRTEQHRIIAQSDDQNNIKHDHPNKKINHHFTIAVWDLSLFRIFTWIASGLIVMRFGGAMKSIKFAKTSVTYPMRMCSRAHLVATNLLPVCSCKGSLHLPACWLQVRCQLYHLWCLFVGVTSIDHGEQC